MVVLARLLRVLENLPIRQQRTKGEEKQMRDQLDIERAGRDLVEAGHQAMRHGDVLIATFCFSMSDAFSWVLERKPLSPEGRPDIDSFFEQLKDAK